MTAMGTTEVTSPPGNRVGWVFLSITRIAIGFIFFWAFIDKLLGLGFSTCRDRETGEIDAFCDAAWINGGAVTEGYLASSSGPFAEFFQGLADDRWTDWPFMIGLAGIGLALMLGIGTKIAAWTGPVLLGMMYVSHAWPNQGGNTTNPFLDDHILQIVAIIGIVLVELTHQSVGFGKVWRRAVGSRTWLY